MTYLRYTYVDAVTAMPCDQAPCRNGPAPPPVAGLAYLWAPEGQYPTLRPVFYGACPDESDTSLTGVLAVLSEAEYAEALAAEIAERRAGLHARRQAARLSAQTSGFVYDGHVYASDRDESLPLLTNAALAAQLAIAQGVEAVEDFNAALGAGWRSTDGVHRITTAAGIVALHAAFVAHGAACDRHSESLKAMICAAETLADLADVAAEIEAGWPEAVPT